MPPFDKSHTPKPFKQRKSLATRKQEVSGIRSKFPNKIPVIIERYQKEKYLPPLDKTKFLVPQELTMTQFVTIIRNRMDLKQSQAFYLLINNSGMASMSLSMAEVYKDHKDEDGFLYMTYASQEMFGSSDHMTYASQEMFGFSDHMTYASQEMFGSSDHMTYASQEMFGSSDHMTYASQEMFGSSDHMTYASQEMFGFSDHMTYASQEVLGSSDHMTYASQEVLGSSDHMTYASQEIFGSSDNKEEEQRLDSF